MKIGLAENFYILKFLSSQDGWLAGLVVCEFQSCFTTEKILGGKFPFPYVNSNFFVISSFAVFLKYTETANKGVLKTI